MPSTKEEIEELFILKRSLSDLAQAPNIEDEREQFAKQLKPEFEKNIVFQRYFPENSDFSKF